MVDMSNYKISEKDIESTVRYLQVCHPEKASREYAIEMLEYLRAGYRRLALMDTKALEDLRRAFEESKTKTISEKK